jgi:uncharacterized membrane protein
LVLRTAHRKTERKNMVLGVIVTFVLLLVILAMIGILILCINKIFEVISQHLDGYGYYYTTFTEMLITIIICLLGIAFSLGISALLICFFIDVVLKLF